MNTRATKSGYTLLEIMISVVIMTIGAAGILAMQGASVHSNRDAAETSIAINFATTWMERVKRDARKWTAVGQANLTGNTQYLTNVAAGATTCNWFVPTPDIAQESAGADAFGFDTTGDIRYCVNLCLTPSHYVGANLDAIRVDLLVWWLRTGTNDGTLTDAKCATALTANQIAGTTTADNQIRKHFLSSVVTWRDPTVTFP